ncbi:hypothetical protein N7509_012093 [Penicillium cosmopolitanum]|uniref:TAFII28-like protein domain-containing protein n=1 Tax=Penicillium cosmopolitanum TaxID=1131564 RepID=A0A9W9SJQ5_9EURO|nr:uncharacterized protein N7509_012093 [Penicillium cosmopolitanum]KAJ5378974.1 hypothetical protein N7509_012093 [Penicillium cosmopolitanum]
MSSPPPYHQTPVNLDVERSFGATSDAGSVTGSFTGSLGGASADGVFSGAAARGKKRGRKSKAEKARELEREDALSSRAGDTRLGSIDGDGASVRGGGGGGGGAGGAGGQNADDGDEDDDYDEGELLGRDEGTTDTEAEKKNLAILVDAFNSAQSERYDIFKRAKLRKESLRRIVNHALSQSVPASVVTTVNGFTKVFAGEIVEKARTVQDEWADAHDLAAREAFEAQEAAADKAAQARAERAEAAAARSQSKPATPTPSGTPVPATGSHSNGIKKEPSETNLASSSPAPGTGTHVSPSPSRKPVQSAVSSPVPPRQRREFRLPPNPHRGQLLPSHLREAVRRIKRDGEGGGVGYSGLSMENLGVSGAFTWNSGSVGGRRLFR